MNKLLLDSHVFLWWLSAPDRLSEQQREYISSRESSVYVSAATAWELSIKHHMGKLPLPEAPNSFFASRLMHNNFQALDITVAHSVEAASLPKLHLDTFDRMLIAQARLENCRLVSSDGQIGAYDVHVIR